jgi:hypothetical protein
MERERHRDRVVVRRRMRADLLVLPHVVHLLDRPGHQRPERLDLLAAYVKEARPDRREQPFVEARAVVVAPQIVAREREVRERVRAVY